MYVEQCLMWWKMIIEHVFSFFLPISFLRCNFLTKRLHLLSKELLSDVIELIRNISIKIL